MHRIPAADLADRLVERVRFRLGQTRQDDGDYAAAVEAYRGARAAAVADDPASTARVAAGLLAATGAGVWMVLKLDPPANDSVTRGPTRASH